MDPLPDADDRTALDLVVRPRRRRDPLRLTPLVDRTARTHGGLIRALLNVLVMLTALSLASTSLRFASPAVASGHAVRSA